MRTAPLQIGSFVAAFAFGSPTKVQPSLQLSQQLGIPGVCQLRLTLPHRKHFAVVRCRPLQVFVQYQPVELQSHHFVCVSVAVVGSNFSCQLVTLRNVNYGCDNGKRWGIPRAFALGWEISPVVLGPTGRTWGHHSNDWANDGKADLTSYVTPWAPWYRPDGKTKEMNITAHGRFWRTRDCTLSDTFKLMHRIQLISLISWCWEYIRFRSTWRVHDFTLLVYPDM